MAAVVAVVAGVVVVGAIVATVAVTVSTPSHTRVVAPSPPSTSPTTIPLGQTSGTRVLILENQLTKDSGAALSAFVRAAKDADDRQNQVLDAQPGVKQICMTRGVSSDACARALSSAPGESAMRENVRRDLGAMAGALGAMSVAFNTAATTLKPLTFPNVEAGIDSLSVQTMLTRVAQDAFIAAGELPHPTRSDVDNATAVITKLDADLNDVDTALAKLNADLDIPRRPTLS